MSGSLSVAMNSAFSGLQVNQQLLGLTSNNIANANTEGYSRKVADLQARLLASQGAGVEIGQISRRVSEFLVHDLRLQTMQRGEAVILDQYYGNMQDMFGRPESGSSISAVITEFGNTIQALSVDPNAPNPQLTAVNAAKATTRQINQMADQTQALCMEANKEIAILVNQANALVEEIAQINTQMVHYQSANQPVGELEDQRDRVVAELAEIMDISYFTRDTGQMVVFTGTGRTLVDASPSAMTYSPSSAMSATVSYPDNGVSPITLGGTDITSTIQGGKLKALIDLRDTILPDFGLQIDQLATVMRDGINAIHNDGTAVPAPATLTGTRSFADPATDTVTLTGTVRIGVIDGDGNAVGAPFDFSLDDLATVIGSAPTVNEIRDALNGAYAASSPAIAGLAGATASVNASGQLVIAADDTANGIAINEGTSKEAATGWGFSHYFGLNDLFVGGTGGGLAANIAVRSDIAANPQLFARGELGTGTIADGERAVSPGGNAIAVRLFEKFQESIAIGEAGGLPVANTSFAGYGAAILAANANSAYGAEQELEFRNVLFEDMQSKASAVSGVNLDEELGNLILYQNAYAASARMISTLSEILKILSELA